ncbi:MAG: cytochrome c family protein [Hyphomicrobiaceae bacterium]
MDSFEFNKIAGGVLSALLFMFGMPELYGMVRGHGDNHGAKMGFELPMPKDTGGQGGAAGPAEDAFSFEKVAAALPKATADAGKDVFKVCTQCHTAEKGGANKLGPNLYGIVDRDIGKHAGFTYSPAVAEKGGKWTWDHLAAYIHDPKSYIPGNRMSYAGVKDVAELADLLAYLRTLSDSPVALPAIPASAPAGAPPAGEKAAAPAEQGAAPADKGAAPADKSAPPAEKK